MLPTPEAPAPGMDALRVSAQPDWFRPDYTRSLAGVYPTLFELLGRPVNGRPTLTAHLPGGAPRRAGRVLLLTMDALGFKELSQSRRLKALFPDYGTWITSVFPSITSCALSSLYQGLPPARHGILGHLIWKDFPGDIVDMLRGKVVGRDVTLQAAGFDMRQWKREPGILESDVAAGVPGFQLMDQAIVGSGLSELIYGDSPRIGYVDPLEGLAKAARILTDIPSGWVSLYVPRVDTLSHVLSGDAPEVGLALRHLEEDLAWMTARLPREVLEDTAIMVAADHGQSTLREERLPLWGDNLAWLEAHTRALGSSGRVMHVYLDGSGAEAAVSAWLRDFVAGHGRVYTFDEIKHLTGPPALFGADGDAAPRADEAWVRRSLGDLVVVLDDGWNWDRRGPDKPYGPYDSRLVSQHGALTWNEMFVPFYCAPLSALLPE